MSFCIVHIIDSMGLGGAQSMLCELYLAIQPYYPEYTQLVISNERIAANKNFIASYGVPYKSLRDTNDIIKKISKKNKPIIIFHKLASSSPNIIENIKQRTNRPVIVINHTLYQSRNWTKTKACDIMVSVSAHMQKKLSQWYPRLNHAYIHNGVNAFRYDKIAGKRNYGNNELITGRINRICAWKYSDKWIEWCAKVKLPKKMVHEYMGGGPRERQARLIIKKNKGTRNKVVFTGAINDFKQKISMLKGWDIFLYDTNRNEGVSMAILEAMASGVPVICSNHYGNKEIIKKGINGYIFKNLEEAREILTDLCSDNSKLEKLKKTTKQYFIENLDAKIMASKYIRLIEKLI